MLKVGIDGGNNTVIVAMEGMEPVVVPTILVPYRDYSQGLEMPDEYQKPLKDCMDAEIIFHHKDIKLSKEMGRFYVGEYAKEMERINVKERDFGNAKKGDSGLMTCMIVALALSVAQKNDSKGGKISEKIKMITGLPCLQFKNDRDEYAKQFIGCHKVIFRGIYNLEVEIDILDAKVDMEGADALKMLIFNDSGEYLYKEEELIDRTILGIDYGEFTSEIIALTFRESDGDKILPEYKQKLCMGIDLGIANAKQPVIDYLRDKYNTIIDRYDIDASLKRRSRRGNIDLENGEMFNIEQMYEENLAQLSGSIATLINNKIKSAGEKGKIKHTLLYGGGVCVLDYKMGNYSKERIQELLGGKSSIVENPHTINALSYLDKAMKIYGDSNKSKTNVGNDHGSSYSEQKRLIYDPNDSTIKKEVKMPLQIKIEESGVVWEAKTIRGAAAIIIGDEYLNLKDNESEWNMRVSAAKKIAQNIKKSGNNKVEVYDCRKGVITDEKAPADTGNGDLSETIKIRIENDRMFLLSLVKAGIIRISERKDTYFLRPHQKWGVLVNSKGALQCCSNCLHRIYDKNIVCPVYNTVKEQNDGTDCNSYSIYPGSYVDEYTGGIYLDILKGTTVEELIEKVGQLWMVNCEKIDFA